jgi:plastocyanin
VIKHPKRLAMAVGALSALLTASMAVGGPATAASTPATLKVGVGAAMPAGHSIEYTDFFPRTGISVHNGDVIDFSVPSGASTDDLHVVALLKQGTTAAQAMSDPSNALIIPDGDDPGAPPLQNLAVFGGTNPPAGSGAPGACGSPATPCIYTGSSELVSGQLNSSGPDAGGPTDIFVKLSLPSGFTGTVTAVDLGHPIKTNSADISVVADSAAASTQSALDQAAASQYQSDTSADLAAESAVNHDTVTTNTNGTHNHTVSVGPSTQYTEAMGFFPATVHLAPGDTVTYNYAGTSDPHTASFPGDPSLAYPVSPFTAAAQCEGTNGDTPGDSNAGPPGFGCANPSAAELPFLPQAMGPSVVRTPAYRLVSARGGIFDFGQAAFHGSAASHALKAPVVATASTGDQKGYYEVTANGGVFTYGDARFFGSLANKTLASPIVGFLTAPDNSGYLLVAANGAISGFGAVPPLPPAPHTGSPVVGLAVVNSTSNGPAGFWLATAKGGVFGIAGAPYFGSMGGKHLAAPIVGIVGTPDGGGYWLVGADGGVFSFGDARYLGGTGGRPPASPISGMTLTPTGRGYWLVSRTGGVFSFGDATFSGSLGGQKLASPIVGIDTAFTAASSGALISVPAGNPNALPSRTSYTFTFPDKGSFSYICEFHEMMTGTVVVG